MPAVTVEVSRFVDEYQPGFVECALIDAEGARHLFVDKVPIVSTEDLLATSTYPRVGSIPCVVEEEWREKNGRSVALINTERPLLVESSTGQTRFVVLTSQLVAS